MSRVLSVSAVLAGLVQPALAFDEDRLSQEIVRQQDWAEGAVVANALGDLDGDGVPERVVVATGSTGGTAVFTMLLAYREKGAALTKLAEGGLGLGHTEALAIRNGRIEVTMLEHGPKDPNCCPSKKKTHIFALQGGKLVPAKAGAAAASNPAPSAKATPKPVLQPAVQPAAAEVPMIEIGADPAAFQGRQVRLTGRVGSAGGVFLLVDPVTDWTMQFDPDDKAARMFLLKNCKYEDDTRPPSCTATVEGRVGSGGRHLETTSAGELALPGGPDAVRFGGR
ncbi:hypothetical protein [Azospirillum sp. SYSU D00513]|uniref:hypothetical protein n=1 Tax=Azospirillum sp. SYSU D00513 TaxID=2812561 RepID=UPI001A963D6F|nr:hypothetical protein [Azospirillum sp. SYSU D00513]